MKIKKGIKKKNYGKDCSIVDIEFDNNYILHIFQGKLSDNDILIRYSSNGKRMRTPKHIHWAVDLLLKLEGNSILTKEFIFKINNVWDNTKVIKIENNFQTLNKLIFILVLISIFIFTGCSGEVTENDEENKQPEETTWNGPTAGPWETWNRNNNGDQYFKYELVYGDEDRTGWVTIDIKDLENGNYEFDVELTVNNYYSVSTSPTGETTYNATSNFVLGFPNIYLGCEVVPYKHHEKLFEEFKKNHDWAERINLSNISDLNKIISTKNIKNIIYMCEVEQNGRLIDIARDIYNRHDIKIVLMAGPSSSGKTTSSRKLSLYLRSLGLNPHSLSIDDYFLDRELTPKKENGEFDFESVEALNIDLFNKHLIQLINNEEVLLPEYNFITGKSEFKNKRLKLGDKDILIIEGLHALNEELTKAVDSNRKYKIYVSPLTSINLDNHNRISSSDNRLLRRMIRDERTRGYKASVTLSKWQNVREGEEKYVFPYQDSADVVFNTSLAYELGVLRVYAEPLLFSIKEDDPYYDEALRLLNILRNVLPITGNTIPLDSIIREFIGGSYFKE